MKFKSMRERLLASSMICGAAALVGLATPAMAQGEQEVQELVVTGSRIPQPNLTSISPIQAVGAQEITLGGRPVTADFLNQLPQVSQNAASGLSSTSNPLSGPGGVATVDLRGIGQQRTLILVDGRRLGIGDPNTGNPSPSPDINQIPSQLIERVDVLTGGASATYGSDAIGGVVNFIMKRDFEGLQVDAQWSVNQHSQHNDFVQGLQRQAGIANPKDNVWDGKARDISIIYGANSEDGRGNVTGFFTYHDQDPVTQGRRDWSACQVTAPASGIASCAGSPNSNRFGLSSGAKFPVDLNGNGIADDSQAAVLGNSFVPWGTPGTSPPQLFNSNDYAFLLQQSTRYTAGFFAHYDVNETFNLYTDFSMMNDRSNVQIAPTGLFAGSGASDQGGFLVNCNNPFLSAQQQGVIGCTPADIAAGADKDLAIGRRNIEGGGRNSFYEHQNYRVVVGTKGKITGPWNYDLYGSYYYTSLYTASQNYLSISKIQNALQVVQGDNGPECIVKGGCVPYNIFQDNGVTDEALAYLDVTGTARGATSQRVVEGTITGDLSEYGIKTPWANDGAGVAFGFQNRREHLEFAPDVAQLSGDLSGAGGASVTVDNSIRVTEVFAEARLPLIQDMPYAKELTLEGGYRYSDYSTGIQANTYKVGLQWAPTEDVRFRASYQRALRAPNLLELYTPSSVTNSSELSVDPCAPDEGVKATATLEQCLRSGVTAAQYGDGNLTNTIVQCPSGQCAVLQSGTANLDAETAKTFSVGFTVTPRFLPGFIGSIDYYDIELKKTIGTIPIDITLQKCMDTGDTEFCSLVNRAPNGTLFGTSVTGGGYIDGSFLNIGSNHYSGVDLQATYNIPFENFGIEDYGSVSLNFAGSYTIKAATVPVPGDPEYDCAGLFGPSCQTILPEWRHTARINWATPWDVTASLAWRYIGSVTNEADSGEPIISSGGAPDKFNHTLPSRSYIDLSGVWNVNDMFKVRAGINNVFDQDPPLVNSRIVGTGLPNTYPTYDLLGRRMFIGFTANF